MRRLIASLVVGGMLLFGMAPTAGAAGPTNGQDFANVCASFGINQALFAASDLGGKKFGQAIADAAKKGDLNPGSECSDPGV